MNGISYTKCQYSISPNSVVSIIAAAVKAALLVPASACIGQMKRTYSPDGTTKTLRHLQTLDKASRGPWGSLGLIPMTRPSLTTAWSIMMVMALAIDPFAQEILSFPLRTIPDGSNTSHISRAQDYNYDNNGNFKRKILIVLTARYCGGIVSAKH